jgi:hypothetical protein
MILRGLSAPLSAALAVSAVAGIFDFGGIRVNDRPHCRLGSTELHLSNRRNWLDSARLSLLARYPQTAPTVEKEIAPTAPNRS